MPPPPVDVARCLRPSASKPALQACANVTIRSGGESVTIRLMCIDDSAEVGPPDCVLITLKAHALPSAAPQMLPLLGPEPALVTGINGVPYWYFHGLERSYRDRRVESVDPGGKLWETLHPARAIGAVLYPVAEVVEPGVIEHTYGDRVMMGDPDGSRSPRVETLAKLLIRAGLKAPGAAAHPRRVVGDAVGQAH